MGKPLDALFKDTDKIVNKFFADIDEIGFKSKKKLSPYIKTLIDKIEGLESENFEIKDEICELKNICTTGQLIELAYILKRKAEQSKEINNECKQEKGKETEHGKV